MFKRFIGNIIFFMILFTLTFFFLIRGENFNNIGVVLASVDIKYIFIGIFVMSFYLLGDAINNKVLLKNFGYNKSIIESLKYAFIGFFYSAITPSSTGGQPMQLYHMNKDGVEISHATIVLLLQACSYHIVTLLYMLVGSIVNGGYLIDNLNYFVILLVIGITITVCVLTVLLGLIFSKKASNTFTRIAKWFIRLFKPKNEIAIIEKLEKEVEEFRTSSNYIKNNKFIFIRVLLITIMQLTAFYSVTYVTMRAFNIDISYFRVITLQAVLFSAISSIPLPGSIGISEVGFGAIFLPIFGEKIIGTATIMNRFMSFYFFVLVSMIIAIITYIKIKKIKATK